MAVITVGMVRRVPVSRVGLMVPVPGCVPHPSIPCGIPQHRPGVRP
jgi:hypothetical protein